MTGLPPAVAAKIAAETGLDPRVGRRARAGVCQTCHAAVLVGLDEDRCAFTARADPQRIDALGEMLAILAGRASYSLDGAPLALHYRRRGLISARSAEKAFIVAEHKCGAAPLPAHSEAIPPAHSPGGALPENPPF